jgi:protein disulfide-isomerase
MNTFERYYNFHFGSLDCIAYGDACNNHEINAFPIFVLYKDGLEFKRFKETKDMESLSNFIEETLESIKPGSRPTEGLLLPEPGNSSVPIGVAPSMPLAKDKDAAAGVAAGQQHMAKGDKTTSAVSSSTLTATKISKPTKPTSTPNPAGTSIPLTQESFQKLVTTTQDPWFIKFYAPWCHHCQALAPNWLQMSKELKGKLNIGEVNCDVESRLCKDVHVKGYPTIHFFRGGERVEYDGLRGLGDLVSYAKKALDIGMGVTYVDAAAFKEMEETEEVIFVYFFDHATTREDFEALDRLTLSLIGHAKLVKTDSDVLADRFKIHTWPRLLVSRDGRPTYYNVLAPKDMRDYRHVLEWMQSVWLPIVPELTASNSKEVMNGRLVVLGVLSRERSDEFIQDKREIKNAALEWMDRETHAFQLERQEQRDAKQLRIEEAEDRNDQRALRAAKSIRIQISESDRQQVGFAWVDGVFWERWIRTTYGVEVKDGERVVITDEDVSIPPPLLPRISFKSKHVYLKTGLISYKQNKRYWDTTISGAPIVPSRTSILETLTKITRDPPGISPKYTTGAIARSFYQARGFSSNHPWLSLTFFVAATLVLGYLGRGKIRRSRGISNGGFFQLDGKEGLLSGGSTGKVD